MKTIMKSLKRYFIAEPDVVITDPRYITALKNTIVLARERLWFAEGKPIPTIGDKYEYCAELLYHDDIVVSARSIDVMEDMLKKMKDAEEEKKELKA